MSGHIPVRLAEDVSWDWSPGSRTTACTCPRSRSRWYLRILSPRQPGLAPHRLPRGDQQDRTGRGRQGAVPGRRHDRQDGHRAVARERPARRKRVVTTWRSTRSASSRRTSGVEPLPGRDLHLTLDVELQKIAEEAMATENFAGAVVAMEAQTGRLLVLASAPCTWRSLWAASPRRPGRACSTTRCIPGQQTGAGPVPCGLHLQAGHRLCRPGRG